MAFRGSLKQCVEQGIDRLKAGRADVIIITNNRGAKYYTLYYPSELDAKLINHPTMNERIVMTVSGGELASIIGTAQMSLAFSGDDHAPS
jgi:hypothetical protein